MSQPQPVKSAPAPRTGGWVSGLVIIALILAVAAGVYGYFQWTNPVPPPVDELQSLKTYIVSLAGTQKLADGYTDANGDMVADPPEAAKCINPSEIGFSVVATEDPEKAQVQWEALTAALQKATGKPVKYLADLQTIDDQLAALKTGRLHVTAFNTGQVSPAVNTTGFVPLFCIADKDGKYAYEMEILVRPDSAVTRPEELKGKTIGLVSLSSNSGGKAPLVILKDKFGMLPGRDYRYAITGDHLRSVRDLVAGKYDAVCVANDMLARAVGAGVVKPEQVKSIFRSESFPPLCFGVTYNLNPELRQKIEETLATFSFQDESGKNNSVGELYKAQGKTKLARVDYARDWKLIREVDGSLTHLLDGK